MTSETTVKCPICGDPYKVFPYYAGDQSACQECQAKANRKLRGRQWIPGDGPIDLEKFRWFKASDPGKCAEYISLPDSFLKR